MLRGFLLHFVVPFIATAIISTLVFFEGIRTGSHLQRNQDAPIIDQCVRDLKNIQMNIARAGKEMLLKENSACTAFCNAISDGTDGMITTLDGVGLEDDVRDCACFFRIGH